MSISASAMTESVTRNQLVAKLCQLHFVWTHCSFSVISARSLSQQIKGLQQYFRMRFFQNKIRDKFWQKLSHKIRQGFPLMNWAKALRLLVMCSHRSTKVGCNPLHKFNFCIGNTEHGFPVIASRNRVAPVLLRSVEAKAALSINDSGQIGEIGFSPHGDHYISLRTTSQVDGPAWKLKLEGLGLIQPTTT